MPVYSMSDKLDSLYVGNQKLAKLYSGNDLIFSSAEEVLYSYKADQNDHKLSILKKKDLTSVVSVTVPGYPAGFNPISDHSIKLKIFNDSFITIPTMKTQNSSTQNARMLINLYDSKTLDLIKTTEVDIGMHISSTQNFGPVTIRDWVVDDDGTLFVVVEGFQSIYPDEYYYTAIVKYTLSDTTYLYSARVQAPSQLSSSENNLQLGTIYFMTDSYLCTRSSGSYLSYYSKANLSKVGDYTDLGAGPGYPFDSENIVICNPSISFNSALKYFIVIDKQTNSQTRYPSSGNIGNSYVIGPIISYDESTNAVYCLVANNVSSQYLYRFVLSSSSVSATQVALIESPGNSSLGYMKSFDKKTSTIFLKSANFIKSISENGDQLTSISSNYINQNGRVCFGKI